jgi:Ca2+-binding EF-hand superfamily protein
MAAPSREELSIIIKAADKDGSGFLTAAELKEVFKSMGEKEDKDMDKTVEMFLKMGDTDGDKKLSIEEVLNLITSDEDDPKERMKVMFRMCDSDGNGFVSPSELATFMKSMSEMDSDEDDSDDEDMTKMIVKMMMKKADQDGDGKINFDEFCKMMG